MNIPLIIAAGGGAIQGGIILFGLLMALLAIPFACYSVFRKKEGRSLVSVVVCILALLGSIVPAAVFGLPYDWTYWGAYLPWIPLLISVSATLLTLLKRKPNQRPERNAGATSPSTSESTPGVAHP